ncbi:AsmA family protein [Luteimonas sp. FCS-9]|uniref:AsmA family protein n=1 Tax=Luteimonas sp. FCS-9 TaxID=1547516 RepID=UPI00063EC7DC|nr:AsmA family protein [Luteimonas sp. FCS-9]KLJ01120.1 hypothetical protein WQ56_07850 [Luteimonas sp. FCS-9]
MSATGQAPAPPVPPVPPRRRRRWPTWLLAALVLLAAGIAAVWLLLPPERALRLVLARLEPALGLSIAFEGDVDYRLRGTPQLVVHDVTVRVPGTPAPMLQAQRVLLALPWKTLRSRGADLEIARVELDGPQLHLPTLLRWLDARPPGDGALPAFTDGLRIRDGRLDAEGWRIEALTLDVPSLHADRALAAQVAGTAIADTLRAPFRLRLRADRPVAFSRIEARGTLSADLGDGRLDTRLALDATRTDTDAPGLTLAPLRLAIDTRWHADATDLPFALGLHGRLAFADGRLALAPVGLATRAEGLVPTLAAGGRIAHGDALQIALDGRIARWPDGWPALPAPLSQAEGPLPFALRYAGPAMLDAPLSLRIAHAGARFDGSARLPDLLRWLDALDTGTPLPPLRGQLRVERVEVSGATLEGVEIDFDDSTAP